VAVAQPVRGCLRLPRAAASAAHWAEPWLGRAALCLGCLLPKGSAVAAYWDETRVVPQSCEVGASRQLFPVVRVAQPWVGQWSAELESVVVPKGRLG